MRISDRNLPKMVSNPGKETSYTDDALKGFTLRVTANGQKVFYYRYVSPIDGKQKRYRVGTTEKMTAKRARELVKDIEAGLRNGEDPMADKIAAKAAWTCQTLLEIHDKELQRQFDNGEISPRTIEAHRGYMKRNIGPGLGKRPVSAIDVALCTKIVRGTKGNTAQNRCRSVLQAIINIAVEHGQLDSNPVASVKRNPEKPVETLLTEEQRNAVLATLTEMENEKRTGMPQIELIRMLIFCGGRFEEIASLRWEDIDWERNEIRPNKFKGQAKADGPKVILLSENAMDVLRRQKHRRLCDFVFPGRRRKGKGYTHVSTVFYAWRRVQDKAGLAKPYLRVHDLRHCFASDHMNNGTPPTVTASLLGHKNSKQVIMRYAKSSREHERRALKEFDARLGR